MKLGGQHEARKPRLDSHEVKSDVSLSTVSTLARRQQPNNYGPVKEDSQYLNYFLSSPVKWDRRQGRL